MRTLRLAMLAFALACVAAGFALGRYSARPVEFPMAPADVAPPMAPEVAPSALLIACELSLADCSTVEPPRVFYADLSWLRAYGVYPEPGVVVLDYGLAPYLADAADVDPRAFAILIHEMAHHVDYATGALDMESLESVCASEARAWYVHNAFMERIGTPELARYEWLKGYEQCRLN